MIRIVQSNRLLCIPDNRIIVRDWILHNVPAGASIYQSSGTEYSRVELYPTMDWLKSEQRFSGPSPKLEASLAYLQTNGISGYDPWSFTTRTHQFVRQLEVTDSLPQYILQSQPVSSRYERQLREVTEALDSCYSLIYSSVVMDRADKKNLYDPLDDFYLPFAGFKNVQRPGPNLFVYQRKPGREVYHFTGTYEQHSVKPEN
jgi:hypothetical protein